MDIKTFVEQYTGYKIERWQVEMLEVLESDKPFILYSRDPSKFYRETLFFSFTLAKLRECWMKGETTVSFYPHVSSLKEKPIVLFDNAYYFYGDIGG